MSTKELKDLAHSLGKGIVNPKYFEVIGPIGKGGFGEVTKAIHKPTGTLCALKTLFMNETDEEQIEMFVREVKILAQCNHLCLLRLLGFTVTYPYMIVTPYMDGGSLYDYVKSRSPKKEIPPTNQTIIAMGIAYALMKLHSKGIIHRDLKSPNILLDNRYLPYVCDFGIARKNEDKTMTMNIGTTYWMAPEQMTSFHYSRKVDVYSYAMVLYEMICKQIPFQGETTIRAAMLIQQGHRPKLPASNYSIARLIRRCWAQDPNDRPDFEDIFYDFARLKYLFDGTNPKGVDAMLTLVLRDDPSMYDRVIAAMKQRE